MENKIRWGIVGLGNIAHSFAKDLQLISDATLYGVASRSKEKAAAFASEYGAPQAFGSYDELFSCAEIDVIYIATPHTSHAILSIAAMEQGKHVLCEKPMGVNTAEVNQMIGAAEKNGVFLMEALWSRFNPTIRKVKALVDADTIGQLKYLYADFGFYALDRAEEGRLLNPALAGGSLLDIGIYPIFLAYLMLGKPSRIQATSNFYDTGVEIQTSMIFDYDGAQAVLYSGLVSKSEMKAELSGEEGNIFFQPRWHETQGYSLEKDGDIQNFTLPTLGVGYGNEIEEVHACLRNGQTQSALWSLQNSVDLIGILDEIRGITGVSFPFEK